VNFATGENHVDLPQLSDNQCANCHTPQGELDFDASIMGGHTIPEYSRMLPGVKFEVTKVDDGTAGKQPTVTFSITDGKGTPIKPSDMTRVAVVLGGPTSDYTTYVSEDARAAQGSGNNYFWTFQTPIPANAKGSYSVHIEGYKSAVLLAGTKKEITVRDAGVNKTIYFSVDGSKVEPRRKVVDIAKCNACHANLSLHGGNRNQIEACVSLSRRKPTNTRRPHDKPDNPSASHMIHKIHT
jgi:OmcA/MtrC family decaheme c-type cytochrome